MINRWFHPKVETGWEKDMPEDERRTLVLQAHKGDYLASARSMQALANVTQDKETKLQAAKDADYFYNENMNAQFVYATKGKKRRNRPVYEGFEKRL